MHEGHVKLFRRMRRSPYYRDSQYVHLWVHLLLSVNWAEKRLKLKDSDRFIDLHPGQVLTSRKSLVEETGINRSKIERMLKAFESEQQIEQQTFSKYRVISIVNWRQYQCSEQQIEQQMSIKRAADEHQMSTKKKVKKDKNLQEGKEAKTFVATLLPICKAWKAYVEMRIKIKKPMTDYAMELRVNDLANLAAIGQDPVAVLNQSVSSNYQDIYPVKEKVNGTCTQGSARATGTKAGFVEANGPGADWLGER